MIKDEVRRLLHEDSEHVYYCWFGSVYTDHDEFSRLDKTYMYCLYLYKGLVHYDQIIGFPTRTGEERIKYTTDITYRVTEGRRRGWILEKDDLREDESFIVSGLHKNLDEDRGGASLHLDNPVDKKMLMLLGAIVRGDVVESEEAVHPEFWLSTTGSPPRLRSDKVSLDYLSGIQGYDRTRAPDDNIFKLEDHIAVDAGFTSTGKKRKAFPYRYFVGRGVRVVSMDLTNQWFRTPISGMNFESRELAFSVGADERV